jgi:LysM repeat protein
MKKQRRRIYAALLCSSMVLSLVSTPVSAAETGQLTNPPTSTEGPGSPESASGNEAAAMLNGLYAALPVANGVKEVATAEELTAALTDSSISGITLKGDVEISSTLTVNRTVTLDLNGCVLKMTGSGSVIKVESGGNLTIQDRNATTQHTFNPHCKYQFWYIDMWELDKDGSEIVSGGVITGGGGDQNNGGGVLVAGGTLTMAGGSIVGCSARSRGGGVYLAYDSATGKSGTFIMTGGSIIGCAAQLGGGVYVAPECTFAMATGSNIHNCIANNDGGGVINHGTFQMHGGTISACTTVELGGGGVCNKGTFIMSDGMIKGCTSPDGQYASGGGVRNSNQFTMTGGTIGDPDNENDASHVYNTSSQETTLTISGNAKIYTDVTNVGILNADGGEMFGTMTNDTNRYGTGTITGSEGAAGSTEFQDKVTNNGTIRKGTFTNEVINESSGTINGGTFTGTVENKGGTISGGDFSGTTLPVKLMITFEPNNGEPVITREVNWSKDGATLTAPASTNEGHILDGWYYDNNGTETKWNFDTDKARYTMTLKAKWTKNTTPIIPGNDTNNIVEQYKTDDSGSGEQTDLDVPAPVVKNTTSYLTYTVQAGDTLWKIARKYSCSVAGIVAANSDRIKNPNRIHAGWQLKIPKSGAPVSGSTPNAVLPENKKSGRYIVKQGDTLWKIARKYNCSVAEIVSLNRELIRDPALIYSGWELKVPQS